MSMRPWYAGGSARRCGSAPFKFDNNVCKSRSISSLRISSQIFLTAVHCGTRLRMRERSSQKKDTNSFRSRLQRRRSGFYILFLSSWYFFSLKAGDENNDRVKGAYL
ncbi:hypothetical protein BJX66DRAFT_26372 [Aspergillus keveii]|uniref:Uncharacterized protein n=1 Tax=Aspergillus keveii TaxID=714993 RepID=A0ABR4FU26_9EURO